MGGAVGAAGVVRACCTELAQLASLLPTLLALGGLACTHSCMPGCPSGLQVIAGGDKGKVGTILEINTKRGEVVVEGVNIKVRLGCTGM